MLSVGGLVAIVYGLSNAETDGWNSTSTLGFIGLGVILLAVFAWVETRVADPLLPMRVLLDRNRAGSYLAIGIAGAGMFGVFLFLTYYLATVLGFEPLPTGLAFLPMIGGLVIAAQLATPLLAKVGAKIPVALGFAIAGTGMFLLTGLQLDSSYASGVLPGLIIVGFGLGFVMAPAMNAATDRVDRDHAGVASATVNTFQQVGGAIGTAVFSAVAADSMEDFLTGKNPADPTVMAEAGMESYTSVFFWSGIVFVIGTVVSGLLLRHGALNRDPDAEPVMAH